LERRRLAESDRRLNAAGWPVVAWEPLSKRHGQFEILKLLLEKSQVAVALGWGTCSDRHVRLGPVGNAGRIGKPCATSSMLQPDQRFFSR
jgi:hypothetical protein